MKTILLILNYITLSFFTIFSGSFILFAFMCFSNEFWEQLELGNIFNALGILFGIIIFCLFTIYKYKKTFTK